MLGRAALTRRASSFQRSSESPFKSSRRGSLFATYGKYTWTESLYVHVHLHPHFNFLVLLINEFMLHVHLFGYGLICVLHLFKITKMG